MSEAYKAAANLSIWVKHDEDDRTFVVWNKYFGSEKRCIKRETAKKINKKIIRRLFESLYSQKQRG
jgi:hypothetical protein